MRKQVIQTILLFGSMGFLRWLIDLFYSPLAGTTTAAQLNDTVESWSIAKFIRDGNLTSIISYITVLLLLLIWIPYLLRKRKKCENCDCNSLN